MNTKNNYKNYISLGYFCSPALDLERLGIRTASYPFDWLISDFKGVISAIETRFNGFLLYENLQQELSNRSIYTDAYYNFHFYHDFDKYIPLSKQITKVQEKYQRRIARFYNDIAEPTLFIRYISDETCHNEKSLELSYIEENITNILALLKSFNSSNDIIFIANSNVVSDKINIYHVNKDYEDVVARQPLTSNEELNSFFSDLEIPNKNKNIQRYNNKQKRKNSIIVKLKRKAISFFKRHFLREYNHSIQYDIHKIV